MPHLTWREYQARLAAGEMERLPPKPHARREYVPRP
jgi:hypothetical protein